MTLLRSVFGAMVLAALAAGCGSAQTAVEKDVPDVYAPDNDRGETLITFDTGGKDLPDWLVPDRWNPDGLRGDGEISPDVPFDLGGPGPGEFGFPCNENADCLSGFCVETWEGKKCSKGCVDECPEEGWDCLLLANSCPDCQYICIPQFVHLCQPCKDNNDCGGDIVDSGDRCVDYGPFGKFCGGECVNDIDCPTEYYCEEFDIGGQVIGQCKPESGVCLCSDISIKKGRTTICYSLNEFGTCYGEKLCTPTGLSECTAQTPAAETCNFVDDNCNGVVDDDITKIDCEVGNAFGICRGSFICDEGNMICDAPQAKPETCDGLDNNCDGATDETFQDSNGDGLADCQSEDDDGDGVNDWDDNCPNTFNPNQDDNDLDKMGDVCDLDDDNDLSADDQDCEPFNPAVHPGAVEQCDGLDNDCDGDGTMDEGYPDFDLDGQADCVDVDDDNDGENDPFDNCPFLFNPDQVNTDGFPDGGDLCDPDDDNDGLLDAKDNCPLNYNPLQADTNKDGIGDDCQGDKDGDGLDDEDDNCSLVFNPGQENADDDELGDACDDDDDNDAEIDQTDCAPLDPTINHYALELCDGIDNNCNSQVDELGTMGCKDYYLDQDGDDWGAEASKCLCGPTGLYSAEDFGDCNDLDPTVNPGQKETCGTASDDNCNGSDNDEDALNCLPFYMDQDGDSFGTNKSKCMCQSIGKYTASVPGDCDDNNILMNPGILEICNNFVDEDCDGDQNDPNAQGCTQYFFDADSDGFGITADSLCLCVSYGNYKAIEGGDCNDNAWAANPKAMEVCGDGLDNNCNGTQNDENAIACGYWYSDGDGDSYGNPSDSKCLCAGFGKYTTQLLADCNDLVPSINPGAIEICNNTDDNCNGMNDEGKNEILCAQSQGMPHVESVICQSGKCIATGCAEGWADANQDAGDGCECRHDALESQNKGCAYAFDLGLLGDTAGGSKKNFSGNEPVAGGDWFRFYAQDIPEPGTDSFHVKAKFLKNPSNIYTFDLYWGGCGGNNQICAEVTDAEWYVDFINPAAKQPWPAIPGPTSLGGGELKCKNDSDHELTPTNYDDDADDASHRCIDNSRDFYINVYPAPGKKTTCEPYELEVSNGVY